MAAVPVARLEQWRARLRHLDEIDAPVVVACSGGPDSLALLALAVDAGLAPVAVHVDHGLRPGSERDAHTVAAAARRLGASFESVRVSLSTGANLEARAREARYDALGRARARLGGTAILVAHTADDQAETVLLNLLRGSATAGLGGMPGTRGEIVRPLLGLRRTDTLELCRHLGLSPVEDPMNDDLAFRRVWVRRELIPALERATSRDVVGVLARQADVLRAESELLDRWARDAWPGAGAAVARDLAALPVALARRAVRCWLGSPPPGLDAVERVLGVARGEARATEVEGGRRVRRSRGELQVERLRSARADER